MLDENNSNSIPVPASTASPFIAAFGFTLVLSGIVTHIAVSAVGTIALLCAAIAWWREVLPNQKEDWVPRTEEGAVSVVRSSSAVDHLMSGIGGHRVQIPAQVHPYSAGLYGGLAGAAAMAVVAMLFGVISQRSPWYPVNLLAAGIFPSLAEAPALQLRQFDAIALLAGSIIHVFGSLLVGLLYAISLPMFPRGAKWRSGLVTPVLWSGLVAATLSVINPTLNARIAWPWFVASQIAFGLTAGWVIARSEKIDTMQSWTLADRAGIEAAGRASAENSDV